jgi:hypothetical protein
LANIALKKLTLLSEGSGGQEYKKNSKPHPLPTALGMIFANLLNRED